MIEYRKGDLFESGITALAHGCNCTAVMGAGIALDFRRRWPDMYLDYRSACIRGDFTAGECFPWSDGTTTVFCLATQVRPGPYAKLPYVGESVAKMLRFAREQGITEIAMPRIGAGIGGLDWSEVASILDQVTYTSPVNLVVYTP